ncbi:hypothetical protein METBIDRAFT_41973 [Metschnikowia bicuspidata var. bicuspidata NRRL YB-4993]|uniref:NUDE domain-containing protein n=1 Tax=Metschnikowia bicuspidata var. bicuspidata NRRL YB-4993 TaxID=869754 RepID=A0A1A0HBA4_9ASCO|nr:hypothetical protein METBIDRAFT_41973 [Metschnikowia bicuspidata var. bicuspidata NRRL YB-4993]OBA21157.1 hypothetical protein METBIDRAFT_41973 [Metschnikowia bicuspidata var. bicuspidata NRRL YB-4993]
MDAVEFEKVYLRMLELELELVEFQESSKDLELALEDELHDLETQKSTLVHQLLSKDKQISMLNSRVISLNSEVTGLLELLVETKSAYEETIADLKHKLVAMEILNDDFLSRDRVVESKLQLANQFNNELLEKLAMVENDLDLERQANAQHKLTISNLSNITAHQPVRLTRSKRDSTFRDFAFAESTVLDIDEMLATEPPAPMVEAEFPRSESLTRFQELCSKSDILRQKVGEVNTSLAFKSLSTAEVSKPMALSFPSEGLTSFASAISDVGEAQPITEKTRKKEARRSVSEKGKDRLSLQATQTRLDDGRHKGMHVIPELGRGSSKKFKLRNVMKSFLS